MLSGGADSVCLLDVALPLGARVSALHGTYGLRRPRAPGAPRNGAAPRPPRAPATRSHARTHARALCLGRPRVARGLVQPRPALRTLANPPRGAAGARADLARRVGDDRRDGAPARRR